MPSFLIVRHTLAADNLLSIALLITDCAGAEIASRKIHEIEAAMQKLSATPRVGSLRHEIAKGLRAIPATGKAVIRFVVDNGRREVRIMAVGCAESDWIAAAQGRILTN